MSSASLAVALAPCSSRMAPHTAFAYIPSSASPGSGTWTECSIAWEVTKSDGTAVDNAIVVLHPTTFAELDCRYEQRGFVCAYHFETAGTYTFTCTVTNKDGNVTVSSVNVTVTADARQRIYIRNAPDGSDVAPGDGSLAHPYATLAKAKTVASAAGTRFSLWGGQTHDLADEWNLTGWTNFMLEGYGGTAGLRWTGAATGKQVLFLQSTQNFLVRDVDPTTLVQAAVLTGNKFINAYENCRGMTVYNCHATNWRVPWQLSLNSANICDGLALINVISDASTENGCFCEGCSDVVHLGYSGQNGRYSHDNRLGTEFNNATARFSSLGSAYDTNYEPENNVGATATTSHAPLRSYMPYRWVSRCTFHGGDLLVQAGSGPDGGDHTVFEECYDSNGKAYAVALNATLSDIRISGAIISVNNRRRSADAPTANDNGPAAISGIDASSVGADWLIENCTIAVEDNWDDGPTEALVYLPGTYTNVRFVNLIVVVPAGFSKQLIEVPASGVSFSGCVFPDIAGTPMTVGGVAKSMATWLSENAGNAKETCLRSTLLAQSWRVDPAIQTVMGTASAAPNTNFLDFYGNALDGAGHRSGAVGVNPTEDVFTRVGLGAFAGHASGGALTLTVPACQVGDLLVAHVLAKAAGVTYGLEAGWTALPGLAPHQSGTMAALLATRVADAGDTTGAKTYTFTSNLSPLAGQGGRISAWRHSQGTPTVDPATIVITDTAVANALISYGSYTPSGAGHVVFPAFYGNDVTTLDAIAGTDPAATIWYDDESTAGSDFTISISSGNSTGAATGARTQDSHAGVIASSVGVVFGLLAPSDEVPPGVNFTVEAQYGRIMITMDTVDDLTVDGYNVYCQPSDQPGFTLVGWMENARLYAQWTQLTGATPPLTPTNTFEYLQGDTAHTYGFKVVPVIGGVEVTSASTASSTPVAPLALPAGVSILTSSAPYTPRPPRPMNLWANWGRSRLGLANGAYAIAARSIDFNTLFNYDGHDASPLRGCAYWEHKFVDPIYAEAGAADNIGLIIDSPCGAAQYMSVLASDTSATVYYPAGQAADGLRIDSFGSNIYDVVKAYGDGDARYLYLCNGDFEAMLLRLYNRGITVAVYEGSRLHASSFTPGIIAGGAGVGRYVYGRASVFQDSSGLGDADSCFKAAADYLTGLGGRYGIEAIDLAVRQAHWITTSPAVGGISTGARINAIRTNPPGYFTAENQMLGPGKSVSILVLGQVGPDGSTPATTAALTALGQAEIAAGGQVAIADLQTWMPNFSAGNRAALIAAAAAAQSTGGTALRVKRLGLI